MTEDTGIPASERIRNPYKLTKCSKLKPSVLPSLTGRELSLIMIYMLGTHHTIYDMIYVVERLDGPDGPEFKLGPLKGQGGGDKMSELKGIMISELQLSVRARKCMTRLNINTLGELLSKTPDELMRARNFGATSLNEVQKKLASLGVSLRGEAAKGVLHQAKKEYAKYWG